MRNAQEQKVTSQSEDQMSGTPESGVSKNQKEYNENAKEKAEEKMTNKNEDIELPFVHAE